MLHQVMRVVKSLTEVHIITMWTRLRKCGEVFMQIFKNLEKIMTSKPGIALAGQIQNRSSQNIIHIVEIVLDHNSDCEKERFCPLKL